MPEELDAKEKARDQGTDGAPLEDVDTRGEYVVARREFEGGGRGLGSRDESYAPGVLMTQQDKEYRLRCRVLASSLREFRKHQRASAGERILGLTEAASSGPSTHECTSSYAPEGEYDTETRVPLAGLKRT